MGYSKQVTIKHPDTGDLGHCFPEAVPGWEAAGWQVADEPTPELTDAGSSKVEATVAEIADEE